jgi:uncharacterized protein with LGFP repeats
LCPVLLSLLSLGAFVAPASATGTYCGFAAYGLIGDRYEQLGANWGVLGCPTGPPQRVCPSGEMQWFQCGTIAWSPDTGGSPVQAVWAQNGRMWLVITGCDHDGTHMCRQPWSNPVYVGSDR